MEGYYKITYTDYYRGTGLFEIEFNQINLFRTALINKDNWTPFTINCVIKCQTKGIYKLSYTGVSPSSIHKTNTILIYTIHIWEYATIQ